MGQEALSQQREKMKVDLIDERLAEELAERRDDVYSEGFLERLSETDPGLYASILNSFELERTEDGIVLSEKKADSMERVVESIMDRVDSKEVERVQSGLEYEAARFNQGMTVHVLRNEAGKLEVTLGGAPTPVRLLEMSDGQWQLANLQTIYPSRKDALVDARIIWRGMKWLSTGKLHDAEPDRGNEPFYLASGEVKWAENNAPNKDIMNTWRVRAENPQVVIDYLNSFYLDSLAGVAPKAVVALPDKPDTSEEPAFSKAEVIELMRVSTESLADLEKNVDFESLANLLRSDLTDAFNAYEASLESNDVEAITASIAQLKAQEALIYKAWDFMNEGGSADEFSFEEDNAIASAKPSKRGSGRRRSPAARPAAGERAASVTGEAEFAALITEQVLAQSDGEADATEIPVLDPSDIDYDPEAAEAYLEKERPSSGDGVLFGPISTDYHEVADGGDGSEVVTMKLPTNDVLKNSRIHHFVGPEQTIGGELFTPPLLVSDSELSDVYIMATVHGVEKRFTWGKDEETGRDSWVDDKNYRLRVLDETQFKVYGRKREVPAPVVSTPPAPVEEAAPPAQAAVVEETTPPVAATPATPDPAAETTTEELEGADMKKTLATLGEFHRFMSVLDLPSGLTIDAIRNKLLKKKPAGMGTVALQIRKMDVRNGVAELELAYTDVDTGKTEVRTFVGESPREVTYNRGVGDSQTIEGVGVRNSAENRQAVRDMFQYQIFSLDVDGKKPENADALRKARVEKFKAKVLEEDQRLASLVAKESAADAAGRDKREDRLEDRVKAEMKALDSAVAALEESGYLDSDAALARVRKNLEGYKA